MRDRAKALGLEKESSLFASTRIKLLIALKVAPQMTTPAESAWEQVRGRITLASQENPKYFDVDEKADELGAAVARVYRRMPTKDHRDYWAGLHNMNRILLELYAPQQLLTYPNPANYK